MEEVVQKPKMRTRKTDLKTRIAIASMYDSGEWTMRELAHRFGISIPRVCQIVREYTAE